MLGVLGAPSAGAGQTGRIGAEPGPGGTVLGRVCVDLDLDGACAEEEPGIGGARLRFEDGRVAIADEEGRFHAVDVATRTILADRSAYGAHAVSVDGLGVTRRFELSARGAVQVELPVPLPPGEGNQGSVEPRARSAPRVEGERVLWPISGTAPPGARVRAGGVEVEASPDGSWSLALQLVEGPNAVGVTIAAADGGLALWSVELLVARPATGGLRIYPARPRLLAAMALRLAGDGDLIFGRTAPGVELRIGERSVRGGADGRFGVWVSAAGGSIEVTARSDATRATGSLSSGAPDRSFDGLLVGELELQLGGASGFLASGRLAGSVSGRWRGFGLDAGVDLDDRDRDGLSLASPRDSLAAQLVLDPLRSFVDTGDRGALQDANPGRGRLWARVEGHGLALRLGSTRSSLGSGELGRHDRSFFGGRVEGKTELGAARLEVLLFGGRAGADANGLAPGVPSQDLFAATGGSLFYLSHRQVVAGSELVRAVWRDPLSRLQVAERELLRGRDYELDPVGGRLLLAHPLSSSKPVAALVGGDPFAAAEAWLLVDYLRVEPGSGNDERGLAGGELRGEAGPVMLAAGAAEEARPGPDWGLLRGSASIDLGAPLRARLEVARSDGQLFGGTTPGRATSLDGGFVFGAPAIAGDASAVAFHAELEGEAGTARWRAWWRERAAGYSDERFTEPVAARERGAIAQGDAGPMGLKLAWVERRGADPLDPTGMALRDGGRAFASASVSAGPVELTLEGLHERLTLPASGSQSAAGVRAAWHVSRGLTLECSHLQAFAESGEIVASTFTAAGLGLQTQEGTLSVRAGWGPELGPRLIVAGDRGDAREAIYGTFAAEPAPVGGLGGAGSAVGGRQRIDGGSLFTEERVVRDPLGVAAGRVVGATMSPLAGLTLSLSGERGERRTIDGTTLARAAAGLSAAWTLGALRLDGRTELRSEGNGEQWLAGGGAEWVASRRLTLGARALLSDGEFSGRRVRGEDGWLSAAWRSDALSILGRLGRVKDVREGVADRNATIVAIAVTAKVLRRATVGLGLDAAHQRVAGTSDDRIAGSLRAACTVAGPFDVAVEYARRGSLDGRAIGDLDAVRAEAGVAASGARLALGYTVSGFWGTGIDPEERDGRFYLRAVVAR
jgi:hypothetical protein